MMTQLAQTDFPAFSYDEVPYRSYTYPQTHPRHLRVVGQLFGMATPNVTTAHVLELGCASGGNLFSQALAYPQAHFTGLDLSQEQIDQANEIKKELGITNIDFIQKDIACFDLKKYAKKFDYIIAHGVLSWVPRDVQDKIFELCNTCLNDNGLALISYNTLPGWNAVRSLREMMQFHSARFNTPREKIDQSRALLSFLADNVNESQSGYRSIIKEEQKLLSSTDDSYIFHDHLEQENHQFYLHEFVANARRHDLDYVGDSAFSSMYIGNMPANAVNSLQAVHDIVLQEQYMDFVTNRRFRRSILCRKGALINRGIQGPAILDFYLTAAMVPKDTAPDMNGQMTFNLQSGSNFKTANLIASAIYLELAKSGKKPVHARELISRAADNYKIDPVQAEAILQESGMALALRGFIELHSDSPAYVQSISDKPAVNAFARYQASQVGCNMITSALHTSVPVNLVSCHVLQRLDGDCSIGKVIDEVTALAIKGELTLNRDGQPLTDHKNIRIEIAALTHRILEQAAKEALLIS